MKYQNTFITVLDRNGTSLPRFTSEHHTICGHIGTSMNPTLTALDLLEITPYANNRKPRVGDVILFLPPQLDYQVVHRIISISSSRGLRTRGDNSSEADPWHLGYTNISGRVAGASYSNRYRKIAGGLPGRIIHRYCHIRRWCLPPLVNFFRPTYRLLSTGSALRQLLPDRLSPRVVTFNSRSSSSHKLLLGRKVIGIYDPTLEQWQIRRPYRLLINESALLTPS